MNFKWPRRGPFIRRRCDDYYWYMILRPAQFLDINSTLLVVIRHIYDEWRPQFSLPCDSAEATDAETSADTHLV